MEGAEKSGFGPQAVESLEACHGAGARGVGEIMDKGAGLDAPIGTEPAAWAVPVAGPRPHPDDPKLDALWDKCAKLWMPCSIHVSDPIWAYEPMGKTNDGLMNGWKWRIELKPDMWGHNQLIESLERAAHQHPKTIFVACHLANLDYDLNRLGQLFDRNPNLFADISARFAETAPIPRFVNQFFQKYSDRVLYGTDMAYNQRLFSTTFRILESNDEHFYEQDLNFNFNYHWPLNGFGLPDDVLKKIYHDNAMSIFNSAQSNAA
jgi:predicted TIM-barrel fold metal-dependent hydrolase